MRRCLALLALSTGLAPVMASAGPATAPTVPVALTFDDLPAHGPMPPGSTRLSIAKAIIAALKQANVQDAYGFVAGSFGLEDPQSPQVLKAWRAAGYPLGNHSWSHAHLDSVGADWYVADIIRNESVIAPLMAARNWHWFRYPYLAEGRDPVKRDAVRSALAARTYRVAAVTINFDDYAYNEPYVRCAAKHDKPAIARLETLYLANATARFAAARRAGGGQIVLLHVGTFTARMLPRLIAVYRQAGSRFVSLAEATAALHPPAAAATDPKPSASPFAGLDAICANAG